MHDKRWAAEQMVQMFFSTIPTDIIARAYRDEPLTELTPAPEDGYMDSPYNLPMWGWMWLVNDSYVEHKIRGNIDEMDKLGFSVFEDNDGRLFLGIDGAGYSFYDEHWIPLYDWFGLHWHDTEGGE